MFSGLRYSLLGGRGGAWREDLGGVAAEASCPRLARGTAPGRAEAGDRRQGEDVDAPQTGLRVFSWSGT